MMMNDPEFKLLAVLREVADWIEAFSERAPPELGVPFCRAKIMIERDFPVPDEEEYPEDYEGVSAD